MDYKCALNQQVNYGASSDEYGLSVEDQSLSLDHSITINGLSPYTRYHYKISSENSEGFFTEYIDQTFWSGGVPVASTIESDDFSGTDLNTEIWSFINPLNDADVSLNGTQALISIPATGAVHDVWTNENTLPRIVQYVNDTDFEVEAKFESPIGRRIQSQGILVEQDDSHVLRLEFHKWGRVLSIFLPSTIWGSSASFTREGQLFREAPMYLKVLRQGDLWTVSYS